MTKSAPHRISISLPEPHYKAVQRLSAEKRVSAAWVIREALREYIETRSPLVNEFQEPEKDSTRV
jgi:metal-responsive CopG/Arc/MetJ family transcriptional regulator